MVIRRQIRPHILHQRIETLDLREVELAALFDGGGRVLDLVNGNQPWDGAAQRSQHRT